MIRYYTNRRMEVTKDDKDHREAIDRREAEERLTKEIVAFTEGLELSRSPEACAAAARNMLDNARSCAYQRSEGSVAIGGILIIVTHE